MPPIVNISDFLKIGVMAFVFIWAANKTLTHVGLDQFKA